MSGVPLTQSAAPPPSRTMVGLAKSHARKGAWMMRAAVPLPAPHDVLIRIRRTAICGTDMHIYNWDEWAQRAIPVPMIFGHEYAGEIVELGSAVTRDLHVGQRVSGEGHVIDLDCAAARAGRFHLDPGTKGVGVNRQGAFAEYLCIPAFNAIVLPDSVDDDIGAILDPFGNAVHVAQQFSLMGEDVLVTGAGPIGIMAAAVARRAGARTVVLTDVNRYRLDLASRLADVVTVDVSSEDLRDVMAREGIAQGFGLEMSGSDKAIRQAIDALAMGGKLAMLGIPALAMEVGWSDIILKAITIRGVYGREMFNTWRVMFGLLRSGLDLSPLITHRFSADRYQEAFDTMGSGLSGKVLLDWEKPQ
jgi:threonine 3-dehydrogenase